MQPAPLTFCFIPHTYLMCCAQGSTHSASPNHLQETEVLQQQQQHPHNPLSDGLYPQDIADMLIHYDLAENFDFEQLLLADQADQPDDGRTVPAGGGVTLLSNKNNPPPQQQQQQLLHSPADIWAEISCVETGGDL